AVEPYRMYQSPNLVPVVLEPLRAKSSALHTWPIARKGEAREIPGRIVADARKRPSTGPRTTCLLQLVWPRGRGTVGNGTKRPVVNPVRIVVGDLGVPEPIVLERLP